MRNKLIRKSLVTAATTLALDADEVRDELGLPSTGDLDVRIDRAIRSAQIEYEKYVRGILLQSTWDGYLDEFPNDTEQIELPTPLQSVTSIKYQDENNVEQTFSSSYYVVDLVSRPVARVALASGQSWPSTYDEINVVVIRFVGGYETPEDIPADIKNGLYCAIESFLDGKPELLEVAQGYWINYRWSRL